MGKGAKLCNGRKAWRELILRKEAGAGEEGGRYCAGRTRLLER